jgi:hypothetical protein
MRALALVVLVVVIGACEGGADPIDATTQPTVVPLLPQPTDTAPEPTVEATDAVFYENCTAVRAAGADPIRRGDPGYGVHLDRDGDGIGCE